MNDDKNTPTTKKLLGTLALDLVSPLLFVADCAADDGLDGWGFGRGGAPMGGGSGSVELWLALVLDGAIAQVVDGY
jgi:hypothetical protein